MTPIIDVHVHVFNALDIPLEGYLRSRRAEKRSWFDFEYLAAFIPGPRLFTYLTDRMRERSVRRLQKDESTGRIYDFLIRALGLFMGQRLDAWEKSLTRDPKDMATDLMNLWPDVDLFVPLLLDYEYWFKNSFEHDIASQVDAVFRDIVIPNQGRFHPFAPFDPARELAHRKGMLNPDGQVEQTGSLELVKNAIERKGFIGVKLYNSLGYKPLGNAAKDTLLCRKRLLVRNDKLPFLFDGHEYDNVLRELYTYCVANEVPITAHCQIGGIEAYPEASLHFGDANFWRTVLDDYPSLRLNLAHFGWNQASGQGYAGPLSWVKDICEMMVAYDHLYADVSHHRVTSPQHELKFNAGYRQMQLDHPGDIDKIKQRILYGSDWHVLTRLPVYRNFLEKYRDVLLRSGFYAEEEMSDFLGKNALNFLGLLPGGKNRRRLAGFYENNNIPPPQWYRDTSVT